MVIDESPAPGHQVRIASQSDANIFAELLDAFNREFDTPTPGVETLRVRLMGLLVADGTIALIAGDPPVGIALLSLRTNVWFDGPVAVLDELYVIPASRNQGFGTALLGGAEAACSRERVDLVEINVDGEDVDARRFYERHGYTDRDAGQQESQLYYSKELAGSRE